LKILAAFGDLLLQVPWRTRAESGTV